MKICCNRRTGGCSGGNRLRKPRLTYERPLAVQQRTNGPTAWRRRDQLAEPANPIDGSLGSTQQLWNPSEARTISQPLLKSVVAPDQACTHKRSTKV